MRSVQPKQYLPLNGATVLEQTLAGLAACPRLEGIVVAIAPHDERWPGLRLPSHPPVHTAPGGAERADSVLSALRYLETIAHPDDFVLVHDAARPCLSLADLDRLIDTLVQDPVGGLLAVPARDTLKQVGGDGRAARTVDRRGLWHALTPQMFRLGMLRLALEHSLQAGLSITDEASAMEARGYQPRLVEGSADNLKITYPEDLPLAESWFERRSGKRDTDHQNANTMRIGHGFDVHAFGPGDHVVLGGVRIAHTQGIVAHSDGDIPIHALCDALLGAAGLGDIGKHFPDTDPQFRNADSRGLLRHVMQELHARGYRVQNADLTVVAQAPRVGPHVEAIRTNLAADMSVSLECVNVKATTTERMGYIGRGEGIAAYAVALIAQG